MEKIEIKLSHGCNSLIFRDAMLRQVVVGVCWWRKGMSSIRFRTLPQNWGM